jgi:hypothetical protein
VTRREPRRGAVAGAAVVTLATLAGACGTAAHAAAAPGTTAAATAACAARVAGAKVASVQPDQALDTKWSTYVTSDAGWTGGDSVYTYALPGEGTLYTYADSFVGGVTDDRRKVKLIYHNLFVVDEPSGMRLVMGGTASDPQPLLAAPYGKDFYLGLGGIVQDGVFQEIFMERDQVGPGSLDNVPIGSVIATFSLPGLALERVASVPDTTGAVAWGSYVHRFGGWTYVYGATAWASVDHAYVARVAGDDLQGPWTYWDGSGWTSDPSRVAPIADDVQTEFGVAHADGMYELVTSRGGALSPIADVWFGCSPVGPWTNRVQLTLSSEVGPAAAATWGDSQVYVYDAMVQQDLTAADGAQLVVSYDRNDLQLPAVMAHASIYQPSYLDVSFSAGR